MVNFGTSFRTPPFRTAKENDLYVISYFIISFIYNLMIPVTKCLIQEETVNIIQFSKIMCSLKILNQLNNSLFLQVIKSAFHNYLVITFLFVLTILSHFHYTFTTLRWHIQNKNKFIYFQRLVLINHSILRCPISVAVRKL